MARRALPWRAMSRHGASCAGLQKPLVLHERRYVELFPYASLRIAVLAAYPGHRRGDALGRELAERAQAERALDKQRGPAAEALAQHEQARVRRELHRFGAEEGGKIAHAVEVAPHVGDALEPAARERHRRDRRHRDHLRRVRELDEPALPAHLHAELRG